MTFDDGAPPDPPPDLSACEFVDDCAPVPDALDLVVEADAMVAVFAADRFLRIDALRRETLAESAELGVLSREIAQRSLRLELAAAVGITERAAEALLATAEALVHRYPALLDSLGRARITQRHAEEGAAALDRLEPHLHGVALPQVIALAEALPLGSFRRKLRDLVERLRAETLAERQAIALEQRRVVVEQMDNGMAWFSVFLPAVEAHAMHGRLTAMAKVVIGHADDERTLDQARADVFADLVIDGTTDALPPEARGIRAAVAVTVPVLALLGAGGVATVEGVGPIPMDRARELCGNADGWMRVLTHPENGIVLSVGRERYRAPDSLRRLVKWRAETCMAPGCNVPADRCEIDHSIDWALGGETSLWNLGPLCTGHHTVRHHGRWRIRQIPGSGGSIEWTSPAGRRYRVDPERRVPTFNTGGVAPF